MIAFVGEKLERNVTRIAPVPGCRPECAWEKAAKTFKSRHPQGSAGVEVIGKVDSRLRVNDGRELDASIASASEATLFHARIDALSPWKLD